jgi:imidazolonepropionase-like amidohydrolase
VSRRFRCLCVLRHLRLLDESDLELGAYAEPMNRRIRRIAKVLGALVLVVVALFTLGVLWPTPGLAPVVTRTPVAIRDVAVVDVARATVLPGRTVLVDSGRIVATGPEGSIAIPAGAATVDGRGKYLLPALWDMHVHVYAIAPLLDLPLYVRYGVLNVRDMQGCPREGDPFIACADDKRRWSAEAAAGRRVGPRIVATTSFMANGPTTLAHVRGVPAFYGTATPGEARAFVRHHAGRVDAIKVYDRIPRAAYLALVDEARRLGVDVVGHRPHAVSAIEAAAHQKSIEHARFILHESFDGSAALRAQGGTAAWREDRRRMVDAHDSTMAREIFQAMARAGTWYVPTHLTRWRDAYADDPAVRDDSLLRYVHPLVRSQWIEDVNATVAADPSPEGRAAYRAFYRKGLELTGAAHRAGVPLLLGTDYLVPGADAHRELEQLVQAGLSPAQALHAATVAPATYMGRAHEHGAVARGHVADLLLLDADPLVDVRSTRRIAAVIHGGNLYDRAALARLDAHVLRQARSWSVGCKILWRFLRQPVDY